MKEIHNIIVPIDFLEHTDQLVEYAGYIAKKFDAKLYLIHAVEPVQTYAGYEYPSLGSLGEEMTELAEKMMQELIDKNRATLPGIRGKVIRGDIVDSIIDFTEEQKADLIVIGTHGRKGLSKMWLGSVAEQVIKKAPCPALTCNPYKSAS